MNEIAWRRLIDKIDEGNVVPIIGARLLVGSDGESSLQAQIARRVLDNCSEEIEAAGKQIANRPLEPFRELNDLVSQLKGIVEPQNLYEYVHEAISTAMADEQVPVPLPLRQLCEIASFRLFVTLTPDGLLARCLNAHRAELQEIIHSPNLPTSDGKDLPRDWKKIPGQAYLLYLFGKARSAPMFAIHDEDVLEYAHNIISRGSQVPCAFLDELQQRNLLLVGCNFPDWLTRFFLRATNRKRLSEKDNRSWVIEPLRAEESLTCFLRSYSRETEVLSQTPPIEFVAELHRRWLAGHGARTADARRKVEEVVPSGAMFFISYSRSTDRAHAEKLDQALLKLGVTENEVWYDRTSIEPGQDFERRIIDGIHGCRYFLPLLSRAADQRQEGFVFTEWLEASERKKRMNRDFLLPIIVDDEDKPETYNNREVWRWNEQKLHFGHAPGGDPNDQLLSKLKSLVREARLGSDEA